MICTNKAIHGETFNKKVSPNKPSAEVIGMEYLFRQINMHFSETYVETGIDDPFDFDEDESIGDVDFEVETHRRKCRWSRSRA